VELVPQSLESTKCGSLGSTIPMEKTAGLISAEMR
jgi:hypothetical protein